MALQEIVNLDRTSLFLHIKNKFLQFYKITVKLAVEANGI